MLDCKVVLDCRIGLDCRLGLMALDSGAKLGCREVLDCTVRLCCTVALGCTVGMDCTVALGRRVVDTGERGKSKVRLGDESREVNEDVGSCWSMEPREDGVGEISSVEKDDGSNRSDEEMSKNISERLLVITASVVGNGEDSSEGDGVIASEVGGGEDCCAVTNNVVDNGEVSNGGDGVTVSINVVGGRGEGVISNKGVVDGKIKTSLRVGGTNSTPSEESVAVAMG